MVEIYEQQIARLDDLTEISALLSEDPNFQKNLQKYINNPYDADVERVAKGVFTLAVSKAESPSLDRYDATIAVTKANNEALSKLACTGARYLTTKNSDDRRINALGQFMSKKYVTPMSFDCKGDTIYLVGSIEENEAVCQESLNVLVKAIENDMVTSATISLQTDCSSLCLSLVPLTDWDSTLQVMLKLKTRSSFLAQASILQL